MPRFPCGILAGRVQASSNDAVGIEQVHGGGDACSDADRIDVIDGLFFLVSITVTLCSDEHHLGEVDEWHIEKAVFGKRVSKVLPSVGSIRASWRDDLWHPPRFVGTSPKIPWSSGFLDWMWVATIG